MTLDTESFADAASWERGSQQSTRRAGGLGRAPTKPFAAAIPWDQPLLQLLTGLIYLV